METKVDVFKKNPVPSQEAVLGPTRNTSWWHEVVELEARTVPFATQTNQGHVIGMIFTQRWPAMVKKIELCTASY